MADMATVRIPDGNVVRILNAALRKPASPPVSAVGRSAAGRRLAAGRWHRGRSASLFVGAGHGLRGDEVHAGGRGRGDSRTVS